MGGGGGGGQVIFILVTRGGSLYKKIGGGSFKNWMMDRNGTPEMISQLTEYRYLHIYTYVRIRLEMGFKQRVKEVIKSVLEG